MTPRIAALIPMRHSSERVRGKNYRILGERPLYRHIVQTLLACDKITSIAIDTDSETIMEDVRSAFPEVQVLIRPEHLRDGATPMNEVLLNAINQIDADFYLQTHSTNPLMQTTTFAGAIEKFLGAYPTHDSLFGVTRFQSRLWTADAQAVNHDPSYLMRTQDLPPLFEENSCVYIFAADSLRRRGNRIGERPLLFEIDRIEAWDIDEEVDWSIVESLYERARAESAIRKGA